MFFECIDQILTNYRVKQNFK